MRTFRFTRRYSVVCDSKSTRNGFKHTAALMLDGREVADTKICYCNRTWESFEYQSVLEKLLGETAHLFSKYELGQFRKVTKNGGEREARALRSVGAIARLGELLCDNQKEKNDWKARMLTAGLGASGLTMPEDWDTLSEDEKARRLDGAVRELVK